jgi:Tol biopolymer transport system component
VPEEVDDIGSFGPIIAGLSADHEPAVRGIANLLTVRVTNVNNLPLTIHWSASAGALTDSTGESATWIPPDSIGVLDVTVSVEATDGNKYYFKTQTYHVLVENEYERWTRTEAVQLDPSPVPGGGLLFAQVRNNATGESDVWRLDAPMTGASQVTQDFWTAVTPSPRADQTEVAFAGRRRASDSGPSIWLVPWGGGDTTTARVAAALNPMQTILAYPRFSPEGAHLLYTSDTNSTTFPKVWRRDAGNFNLPPQPLISSSVGLNKYFTPSWGPDSNNDGFPDSMIARGAGLFDEPRGLFKFGFTTVAPAPEEAPSVDDPAATEPDWSRDGQYIVYAKRNPVAGDRDIWIIPASSRDSTAAVRVTGGPADDSYPRFSADGMTIYFVSNRADRYGLNGLFPTERRGTNIWSVTRFDQP